MKDKLNKIKMDKFRSYVLGMRDATQEVLNAIDESKDLDEVFKKIEDMKKSIR